MEAGDQHRAIHTLSLLRNRGPKDQSKKALWTSVLNTAISILEIARDNNLEEVKQMLRSG